MAQRGMKMKRRSSAGQNVLHCTTEKGEIYDSTRPTGRRSGYGSRMMEVVLRDITAAGYTKVMLWVFEENVRARRFYEAHGFSANGKVKSVLDAKEICYEKGL